MTGAALTVPSELLDAIATRVADELERRGALGGQTAAVSPWMTTAEAADYLRCSKQRVFDLTSAGALHVHKDGARNLYRRSDVDAYLAGDRGPDQVAIGAHADLPAVA